MGGMKPSVLSDVVHRWAVLVRSGAGENVASGIVSVEDERKAGRYGRRTRRLFLGHSELAGLMRAYDWSRTPLGPPNLAAEPEDRRPHHAHVAPADVDRLGARSSSTSTTTPTSRSSAASIRGRWASPRPSCGARSGTTSGPMLATAMGGDEGTYDEAQLLIMERNGYPEETYYTFSYSPVPNDDGGAGGIICANTDDTQRVIGERQLALLRELARATAGRAHLAAGLRACAPQALATNPRDLPFALIYLAEPGSRTAVARRHVRDRAGITRPPRRPWRWTRLDPWPFGEALREPRTARRRRSCREVRGPMPDGRLGRPPSSAVVLPIAASGETGRRRASSSRASTRSACSTTATPASSTWSPARSPPPSPTPRPTRRSAGAPRRWPRSTAPRRRSSPTSATSSARR